MMLNASAAAVSGCIVGKCTVRLWTLSCEERLRRLFARAGVAHVVNGTAALNGAGSAVLVRADHLFDERVIKDLVDHPGVLLETDLHGQNVPVAAHVPGTLTSAAERWLRGEETDPALAALRRETPASLSKGYIKSLRKFEAPVVVAVRPEDHAAIERYLFDGAYKGVTDAITKWVWPTPARWVVGICARLGIRPNQLTALSVLLVLAVCVLFARGQFAVGLVLGWLMTFLDTVDGKLARVTLQSTRFGHYLDHVLDIVHPPIWYFCWGWGLSHYQAPAPWLTLNVLFAIILVAYVVGRVVEGSFSRVVGRFSIFTWKPVDSYFRLVVARRNPCLVMLTLGLLAGRPEAGLLAVAAWSAFSALFLLARLATGVYYRAAGMPMRSWLIEQQAAPGAVAPMARPFVRHSAARNRLVG